ncbi:MAG: hypothetical protein ACON4Z_12365 [Planctomycetota bacterium]
MSRAASIALVACLAAATAAAQSGKAAAARQRHDSSVALHRAWLREHLDLDAQAALQSYEQLRRSAPPTRPERWIAIARLAELGRLGVTHPEPGALPMQAPLEVQEALEQLAQPVPWQRVLADPDREVELPRLRPATERVMTWGRDQVGPTVDQRWIMQMRDRDRSGIGDTRWRNRNAAFTLLDVELEGKKARADSLRRLMFVGWKPPALEEGVEAALTRARGRLRDMIEGERSSRYRVRLQSLERRVEELAERSHEDALALMMRLPFLAEELLLPVAPSVESTDAQGR